MQLRQSSFTSRRLWRRGVVVSVVRRMNKVTLLVPVSTRMGDSRYTISVCNQPGQLSLARLWS